MEAAIVVGLCMLGYICWNILEIKDGIEHINARLNNLNITKQDIEDYQIKKEEIQESMNTINEKCN